MTYYIENLGCAKNQVDAETLMLHLDGAHWKSSDRADDADLIIVNSCGFIEAAKKESINTTLNFRKLYAHKKIILSGCLAERYRADLEKELPEADSIFGNRDLAGIVDCAANIFSSLEVTQLPQASRQQRASTGGIISSGERPLLSLPGQAFVKISEGCNNSCAFCAIPKIRGALRSRSIAEVTAEAAELLRRGVKELTIVAQDAASYGKEAHSANAHGAADLLQLLDALTSLTSIEGDYWIRILYIHPENFPPRLLDFIKHHKNVVPYFDLPFQHGSAPILKAMGRKQDAAQYLGLIENIRTELPAAFIRSTFMVGFPGESDADFDALLRFQEAAQLDWLGVFCYSREEDTAAFNMKGRVTKKIAAARKKIIEDAQLAITEKRLDVLIGATLPALIEEEIITPDDNAASGNVVDVDNGGYLYIGRLYCHAPEVDGAAVIKSDAPLTPGTFVRCTVTGRSGFDIRARAQK
jgi:ribosomal protein S12 methylthiotransferase